MGLPPAIPFDAIRRFCEKWKVAEFSLFGSILRDDFAPDSDVDVLVRFAPGQSPDAVADAAMIAELEGMFGRRVDLVEADTLVNPFRRRHILQNRRVVYAA